MGAPSVRPSSSLPSRTILLGDARERLAEIPSSSIDCVITSPPYFGLRNYGHEQQLGAEGNIGGWVDGLRAVCCELARVLKPSGSLWLNVGDSYSNHPREGAPPRSLLLGPQRLALGLVADGWLMRNQVVWAKTNPMPCSVANRLSYTHEILYFLVRSPRYFFDLDAIRAPFRTTANARRTATPVYPPPEAVPPAADPNGGLHRLKTAGLNGHPLGKNPGDVWLLPTASLRGEHFATFPPVLVERPLLATCPERVCASCGQPWVRVAVNRRQLRPRIGELRPGCRCVSVTRPGVVLDPFMGCGTVALVAEQHSRDWVGIELNPVYVALAEERLREWRRRQHTERGDDRPYR
jgi:site-specific DNA-methyltransferase (adenine-specific)